MVYAELLYVYVTSPVHEFNQLPNHRECGMVQQVVLTLHKPFPGERSRTRCAGRTWWRPAGCCMWVGSHRWQHPPSLHSAKTEWKQTEKPLGSFCAERGKPGWKAALVYAESQVLQIYLVLLQPPGFWTSMGKGLWLGWSCTARSCSTGPKSNDMGREAAILKYLGQCIHLKGVS